MAKKQAGRRTPKPPAGDTARMAATSSAARAPRRRPTAVDTETPTKPFKVRALQLGYYDNMRRRPGDVFTIQRESEFSTKWMERVDGRTPDRITTPNQALSQRHDEILAARHGERTPTAESGRTPMSVGDDSVPDDLPTGDANPLGDV